MKNLITIALLVLSFASCQTQDIEKRTTDFNGDWQFFLEKDTISDVTVPAASEDWKTIRLPHDWSVEASFDSSLEGCTGYLPGGTGWYKKSFSLQPNNDEKVFLHFDGVYNNSEYWINGEKLGVHPYGYSPFYFDITSFLKEENEVVVKVDHTRYADSRWYTGSGIYRNVELIRTSKLYIPIWGTSITTPKVSKQTAKVQLDLTVNNEYDSNKMYTLETDLVSPNGDVVKSIRTEEKLAANAKHTIVQSVEVNNPMLWDVAQPNLYIARTRLLVEGKVIGSNETKFGIRSIRFDAEKGFFLNNVNMKIKGVCLHHDGGLVGSAVPKDVWRRRLLILKDGGCNAIRSSHNPASSEFLDVCDELGFLVQDEFFDEWDYPKDKRLNMMERHDDYITRGYTEHFHKWGESDLKNTILSHRNHPSIFQWSIGNEIEWTYPRNRKATGFFGNMNWDGNYFWSQPPFSPKEIKAKYESLPKKEYEIGTTAQILANWTREIDTTRPITANAILPSASFETGYADAVDVLGFSYRRVMYDYARKNYPNKAVMGTENLPQWHEWKAIQERDFISGTFLWTGIDYMGESNGQWPRKTLPSGLIDQAGFKKSAFHMYKTLWSDQPHIYMCTQTLSKSIYNVDKNNNVVEKKPGKWKNAMWIWHETNEFWNYAKDELVVVEVLSNCEQVELTLDGVSLGIQHLKNQEDRIYKWAVPYKAGKLVARGVSNGKRFETVLQTASAPVAIKLTVDRTKLDADSYQVAHVVAQLVDKDGNAVKNKDVKMRFQLDGAIINRGIDNGNASNVQDYQDVEIVTSQGRCLLILQENSKSGSVIVSALAEGLKSNVLNLKVK